MAEVAEVDEDLTFWEGLFASSAAVPTLDPGAGRGLASRVQLRRGDLVLRAAPAALCVKYHWAARWCTHCLGHRGTDDPKLTHSCSACQRCVTASMRGQWPLRHPSAARPLHYS